LTSLANHIKRKILANYVSMVQIHSGEIHYTFLKFFENDDQPSQFFLWLIIARPVEFFKHSWLCFFSTLGPLIKTRPPLLLSIEFLLVCSFEI